jgi:8-oxo-dGTP pyrophosphatase MutT (NUDIX family)
MIFLRPLIVKNTERRLDIMEEEKILTDATLCFLIEGNRVLLAKKARKIGKGCWNGYGGGIEKGETPEQAMVREFWKEAEVVISENDLEKVAIFNGHNITSEGEKFVCHVHVFLARKWEGEPVETEEMLEPTWFDLDDLPFGQMMPADKEWLSYIFRGGKFVVEAYYDPFQQTSLKDVVIREVDGF